MRPEVDEAMRRTKSYWYEDGLVDVAVGAIMLAISLLFVAETLLPSGFLGGSFAALGLPVVILGGGLIARWLVRLAKERITYPRTGYVRYQRPPRRIRPLAGAIGATIAAILVFLLGSNRGVLAWIPALEGLFIGAFILYIAYFVGVARYYALAVLSVIFGLLAALAGVGDNLGVAAYFGGLGLAFVVSGVLTLRRFVRQNRPPAEA